MPRRKTKPTKRTRMTEDEIIACFIEGDKILQKYVEAVGQAAEDLAEIKSNELLGADGYYSGDLGCCEAGIDTICLHLRDYHNEANLVRLSAFEDRIRAKLKKARKAAGIPESKQHVFVSGHY